MKIIVDQRDDWKPGDCYTCRCKCAPVHGINPECGLAKAVEAVEVRLVEDGEAGAGIIDAHGKFYHEEDTLFVVEKGE